MADLAPGLHYDVPAHVYHSDPCATPSLSASIAHVLTSQSPRHAWTYHPRLGGLRRDGTIATDKGSVIHALLLDESDRFAVLDFADYRKDAAKQARDDAKAAGQIPILRRHYDTFEAVAEILRRNIAAAGIVLASNREVTAIWNDDGVACRARMDLLSTGHGLIQDLKSCVSAHPSAITRSIVANGYDIQDAAYLSAIQTLEPELAGRVAFEFIFFELEPPYCVTPVRLGGSMRELGQSRWHRARETWKRCLAANEWPGYATTTVYVEAPPWAMASEFDEVLSDPPEPAPQPVRQTENDNDPADAYF